MYIFSTDFLNFDVISVFRTLKNILIQVEKPSSSVMQTLYCIYVFQLNVLVLKADVVKCYQAKMYICCVPSKIQLNHPAA